MTTHQTAAHLEILLFGDLAQTQNFARPPRIGSERFFHKDVDALLDRVGDMGGPEGRMRGLDHDVARTQAVDRLAIGVEPQKTPLRRHVHLRAEFLAQLLMGARLFVLENIGHGKQLGRPSLGGQGIGGRPAASPAATDQGDPNRVIGRRVHPRHGRTRKNRAGHQSPALRQKLPPRGLCLCILR